MRDGAYKFSVLFWSGLGTFAPLRVACNQTATAKATATHLAGTGVAGGGMGRDGGEVLGEETQRHSGRHRHKQSGVGNFCGQNGLIPSCSRIVSL